MLGCAADRDQPGQDLDQVIGGAAATNAHGQGLTGVLVDDVGQLHPPPISGLIELEVDRPDLVGSLGPQPLGPLRNEPAAFAGPDRAAQTLLAPEPPDALVVHPRPGPAPLSAQHPPAPPGMLPGDAAQAGSKSGLLVRTCQQRTALGGAMLAATRQARR